MLTTPQEALQAVRVKLAALITEMENPSRFNYIKHKHFYICKELNSLKAEGLASPEAVRLAKDRIEGIIDPCVTFGEYYRHNHPGAYWATRVEEHRERIKFIDELIFYFNHQPPTNKE